MVSNRTGLPMTEPPPSPRVDVKTWIGVLGIVAATILAVVCWRAGTTTSDFGPILEGAPPFESTHYDGLWISGAGLSILVAGLMAIDVVRRVRVGFVASQ